jgi:hypothetical protein
LCIGAGGALDTIARAVLPIQQEEIASGRGSQMAAARRCRAE